VITHFRKVDEFDEIEVFDGKNYCFEFWVVEIFESMKE